MIWKARTRDAFKCAVRALKKEIFGFSFGYPLYIVPESSANCLLLEVLAGLSREPRLAEYAQRWSPKQLSALDRAEIYLGFVLTKNANRLRYRTWRQKADKTSAPSRTLVPASVLQAGVGPE